MELEKQNLRVERLDAVAKVLSTVSWLSRARTPLLFVVPICILLTVSSEASRLETVLIGIVSASALLALVALWTEWRYKLYVVAALCLVFGASGILWQYQEAHKRPMDWFYGSGLSLMFLYWGCAIVVTAHRYAVVNGDSWREEREQVDALIQRVARRSEPDVLEFSTGNFWRGYWTYRLYNLGTGWLVARFKKGSTKLVECRVRGLSEIVFHPEASGNWNVDVMARGKTTSFRDVDLSGKVPQAYVQ
ncbi:hypothetical protein Acid345_2657 [Candidatus Koribacter versatilis Ellin345]|uniref:Uncharacterized protein n=1 Tax=Koribacter versatilis (strain Ellin345) TaxID=204669 RepID=Q1IN92_KORVE|nr:hypothetical protein Acid345_2657 [Candidatus Koribacter versatilis Ellin345]